MPGAQPVIVDLPHTWNGTDGQDGGDDYKRCPCTYTKNFAKPELGRIYGDKVTYYVRKGKHYLSRDDWQRFLSVFDRNLIK